jgi:hypothetical protein
MSTYIWQIKNLDTVNLSTEPNFVVKVDYFVTGMDGTYVGTYENSSFFNQDPNQPDFIPYENLTSEIVIGWVQSKLTETDYSCIYGVIEGQIESQKNPPPTPQPTPLPWE